ncbi:MAG: DUF1801 domain-containing protein [Anaerolineaceae bacterium]|nr:DUF1801 domain-containing protein [Anaerolineaceae bacterium]
MNKAPADENLTPSLRITNYITGLNDWRGQRLAHLRQLILAADPSLVEDWKWETPVWSHTGGVLAAGAFKDHVKLNFFKGAVLEDLHGLFNAGLDAKASRAIDFSENDAIDEGALQDLIRTAAALNAKNGKK